MKKLVFTCIFIFSFMLYSCSCNTSCDDDDFRTTPTTNNPLVIPDVSSPIPGMPNNAPIR